MPATFTPLRYPGGKTKYTNLFIDIIAANGLDNCTFVEVFAGGSGAAIKLLLKGYVKAIFLNDLDVAIYSFWLMVKKRPSDLIDLIHNTEVNMAEWRRQKAIYEAKDITNPLALAFATFFLNRCNHSGIIEARPIGGMTQGGTYKIDARYNKATSIAKIEAIAKYAEVIEVFNLDGVELLAHLKQTCRDKKFLIYFDPPYFQKGPALYLNHFSYKDHIKLRDCIIDCPFSWLLSYDNHDEIIALYQEQDCDLYRMHLRHTITGNANAEELIISRLTLPEHLDRLSKNAATNGRRQWLKPR
jgi:DNA adenine methylase